MGKTMADLSTIQADVLEQIAGIRKAPVGAFNIRLDGKSIGSTSTKGVVITFKPDGTGMDINVMPGVKETVYIPVVISNTGLVETVLNDFFVGEGADVKIVAGCGIHNTGDCDSQHDGVHTFYVGKNARVSYEEKHYGTGEGTGERILNPVTDIFMEEGSHMEMDTVQIEGVDSTKRLSRAKMGEGSSLVIREKLMTHGKQNAETTFHVDMDGADTSVNLISRSVAKGSSKQAFLSKINGNNRCAGHSECDAIIMDTACVQAIPEITANHVDASLIHEAAIGKIAGEQITKLMTLGLTQSEAEARIVEGFLK
jgi:Fe-S cluster assembly scaffold protein SufB